MYISSGNGPPPHHNEWAMQVDHISVDTELAIRAMSEREHYIRDGLCFICGEKGHMSGECPKKKFYQKGKGLFKGGKKRRSGCDHHIQATSDDGDDDSGTEREEVQESKPDYTKNVRALMKGMSKDK